MALSDLIRPRSRQQVVQRMLTVLATGSGVDVNTFTLTNYVPGDPLRTLLEIAGEGIADAERYIAQLAAGGYLATAEGEWLTVLAESHYATSRQPSTFARGVLRFAATLAGAVNLPAGMISGTGTGLRYFTRETATVPAGGYIDVEVQAEQPGSAYNVPVGTVTTLHTPLPGLSVTNPAGWLIEAGADAETDASLRRRAGLRWAELGGGATRHSYEYWAYTAAPAVDRVLILDEHPRGQGTVDVVVWGSGGMGSSDVAAVNAYIQARRPLTADVQVYAAHEVVVNLPIEVYAPYGDQATITAGIQNALAELQRTNGIGQRLYQAQFVEAAMLPPGVLDAHVASPDIVPSETDAVTLHPVITFRSTP